MESDENYFARRAEEERAAAERSSNPYAADTHLRLAEAYQRRSAAARLAAEQAALPPNVLRILPAAE